MRRHTHGAWRAIARFSATALATGGIVALAAGPASATTITVHNQAQLASAWGNPSVSDITLAANINVCGTLTRPPASQAILVHGANHVVKATCTGSLLVAGGTAAIHIVQTTLRDAKYDKNFRHGAALEAVHAPVQLSQSIIENNNAVIGAVQAKSLVANGTQFLNNGALATNLGFGAGGATLVGGGATITNSTFSGNDIYGDGAGLRATGHVTVTGSTFSNNSGKGGGEAISAASAAITNSTFSGNLSYAAEGGGAVGVTGSAQVTSSTFTNNSAGIGDGGALGGSTVAVVNSTFSGNSTDSGHGGAITGNDVSVTRSTFHGNSSAADGGAIHVGHSLQAVTSTFDSNSTTGAGSSDSNGGAISGASGASLAVVNSTITNNSTAESAQGSAIYVDGLLRLQFDTIDANPTAPDGNAPVSQIFGTAAATLNPVRGTVVSGGAPGRDCTIATTSGGSNYDDDGTCGFNGTGDFSHAASPQLGMLRNNGGPTFTQDPAATSPLVNVVVGTCLALDQRGVARPQGSACDIGSVERIHS
ncbi:MAG TPA: choice-of-anchor Q domain-containing protein [Acidimicrobiia bacterium]